MISLSLFHQKVLSLFRDHGTLASSALHERIVKDGDKRSLVTIKRVVSLLATKKLLRTTGSGRSTSHRISALGRLFTETDTKRYAASDPDRRSGLNGFNFELLPELPSRLFLEEQTKRLETATQEYRRRIKNIPPAIQRKELERLIIELSWKSSKIEGNTYSLLDTEKLLLENKESPGHDRKEAVMILNHKDAFQFIHEHRNLFKVFTRANVEEVHRQLTKGLDVGRGFRKNAVGVTGSTYRPLDNVHQIRDAMEALGAAVKRAKDPYGKALIALLGISYIQPFEDGNKRTSRLMANALLMAYHCAPLSYRSVEESDYRDAMLTFYELNSLTAFRIIFIDQYEFAAHHYAVK